MRILGIDPGSTVTAFGVVDFLRGRYHLVEAGHVRTRPDQPVGERLQMIHVGLAAALARTHPTAVAIEAIFRHKSSESALRLGQARGVALLAIAEAGFVAHEYNPSTIKASVGAHGRADKNAIRRVVEMLLGCSVAGPSDVTDAIAIAITHAAHSRTRMLVAR